MRQVTRVSECRTAENKPKGNSVLISKDGWKTDDDLRLVYLNEFPLETPYTAVIGTVRRLNEAYRFAAGCLDKTGVGEGPFEEIRGFMRGIDGVTLTAQVKEDVMGRLKLAMEHGKRN